MSTLTLQPTREDVRIAHLAAFAIMIHIFEAALPSPFPGVKLGLANVITIATLLLFGWKAAAWVSLLRVLVGSLLIGTFLSPTFAMSLAGAISSVMFLGICWKLFEHKLGAVGYSLIAAQAHMMGQFLMAYLVFIPNQGLLKLLPVFMTLALVFGLLSGIIANAMVKASQVHAET
ncbi:MAG: Gx transporter family protein [Gammaproteobacteria bacterium]